MEKIRERDRFKVIDEKPEPPKNYSVDSAGEVMVCNFCGSMISNKGDIVRKYCRNCCRYLY